MHMFITTMYMVSYVNIDAASDIIMTYQVK